MPKIHKHRSLINTLSGPEQQRMPYLALLLATGIWGIAIPVIKFTEGQIPTFTFLFLRFLFVGLIVIPYVAVELRRVKIPLSDIKSIFILGILGQASIAIIFLGLRYTGTIDTAIISALAPILTMAAGHYFYNEKTTNAGKFGVLLAAVGALYVVFSPVLGTFLESPEFSGTSGAGALNAQTTTTAPALRLTGNLLVLLYHVFFTAYILFSKVVFGENSKNMKKTLRFFNIRQMKHAYSPGLVASLTFFVALAVMLPLALLENMGFFGEINFTFSAVTVEGWLGLLYMAVFSSIVAYVAFEWGVKKTDVNIAGLFSYLTPLFTIPAAYVLLAETPSKGAISGAVLMALGVLIAESNPPSRRTKGNK